MAILNSKSGSSFDTESRIRTNPDGTTTQLNVVDVNDLDKNVTTPTGKTTTKADSFFSAPEFTEPEQPTEASPEITEDMTKQIEDRRDMLDLLGLGEVTDTMKKLAERGTKQAKLEEEQGIGEMGKVLTKTQSAIREKQLRFSREQESIERQAGLTSAQKNARLNQVKREQARELADDYIIEATQRDDLTAAQNAIDRKIELEFEPMQDILDIQKFTFEQNKDIFSEVEKREYEKQTREQQAKIDEEKDRKKTLETLKITMLGNGAPASVMKANTLEELASVGSNYFLSRKEKLEVAKLQADVDASAMELAQSKAFLGGSTGDAVSDIIAGSAKNGKKYMTDSQLEKVQQAQSALASLDTLQGLLVTGEDGVNLSGPITGRKRELITKLGGDASASAIKATIQGLIPTVARGIFGEVGVLTDADIENYKKTIPNLTSTEDQNKLIAVIMYDTLMTRMANTLTSNANNGKNVSNFLPDYSNMKSEVNRLKSELGVKEEATISPEADAYLNGKLGDGNLIKQTSNAITSFSSQFTRKTE